MWIKVQWLNVYGHILADKTVDQKELIHVQQDLPKEIEGELATGIAWYKNHKYVATYWYRGEKLTKLL